MEVLDGDDLAAFIRRKKYRPTDFRMTKRWISSNSLAKDSHTRTRQASFTRSQTGKLLPDRRQHRKVARLRYRTRISNKADVEGETTVFDPGELGALTLAYATIEMFEGVEPDPRDDIYAMAIIAYQLFTGKHPYGRKNAPKAQEEGLCGSSHRKTQQNSEPRSRPWPGISAG